MSRGPPLSSVTVDHPHLCGNRSTSLPTDYLVEINQVLLAMAHVGLLLNSTNLSSGISEQFSTQEESLAKITHLLDQVDEQITALHQKQPDVILDFSSPGATRIDTGLTRLKDKWDSLKRTYNDHKSLFEKTVEEWRCFHSNLDDFNRWLTQAEKLLADARTEDGLDLEKAREHQQELEEGINSHSPRFLPLFQTRTNLIRKLSSTSEACVLDEKLGELCERWHAVSTEVLERQLRYLSHNCRFFQIAFCGESFRKQDEGV